MVTITYKNISAETVLSHLKDGAPVILECLTHILNLSFNFQLEWCRPTGRLQVAVVPLFKSGSREKMDNLYQPISVLPVISKIAEKVVYHQLFGYVNANNLLSPCQSGFRRNFFTKTAVTVFMDEIRRKKDNSLLTGAVFIELNKAFDTIDHHILLNELQRYGVCDKILLWFSSYLQGRFPTCRGRQISLLSPGDNFWRSLRFNFGAPALSIRHQS